MARPAPSLPLIIATASIALALVLGIGLFLASRWALGGYAVGDVDSVASRHAETFDGQLCRLGAAVTEYATTQDTERFYTVVYEIWIENRTTYNEVRRYIDSVKTETEARTAEGYAALRAVELLWEANNATEAVIGSTYFWSEHYRKEPGRAGFSGDWANTAMQGELFVMLLGIDRSRSACAKGAASLELIRGVNEYRAHVAKTIKERMTDYRDRAARKAAQLTADPQRTPEAQAAAAEDLQLRDRRLNTDLDGMSRKTAMRLFGIVPD